MAATSRIHAGQRPGARGHNRPHPGRLGAPLSPPDPLLCARLVGPLARPFCALRVLPRRGPCPCARPLRRGAPAAASRGRSAALRPRALFAPSPAPPPGASPPAPPLGARRGAPPPLPSPLAAAAARALPSLRCGLPVRSPLLRLGRGPWASRRPAGSPPPRPLRGFGGGWLPPRGPARPSGPLVSPPAPGALSARPRLRGLAVRLSGGVLGVGGFSPAPPRPAAPAGGSGGRRACSRWLRPPLRGSRFSRPSRGPPCGPRGPPSGPFGPVDSPKIVNRNLHAPCSRSISDLTFPARWAILFVSGLFAPLGGPRRKACPCSADNPARFFRVGLFYACCPKAARNI